MATKESIRMTPRGVMQGQISVSGKRGGTGDYRLLTNKPSINGIELLGNKTNAELGIPTDTSDLTNTAGFITNIVNDLVYYYSKLEIDDIIAQIKQSSFRVVDDLPLVGEPGVIYLVLNPTPQSRNYYNEYIYADNRWEKIGDTEIDLSGYVTEDELTQVLINYITNSTLNETLRNYYNKADINQMMAGKADVSSLASVATSGSYNDLINKPDIPDDLADLHDDTNHRTVTDAEKTQWNAAEANVQADWNQTTTSADDYIKNKPTNLVQDANYIHTDNNFTNAYKTKLSDIEAGAEVNVQSDWNQSDNTADDYIKNKPTIPDAQIQSDWNQTSGTAKDFIKNKPTLGTASALDVATSGDASATQVVKGDDSRLNDARTPVSHTHTLSEITDAGSAASKDSTSSVTAGSSDLVESGAVKTAIDNAISGAYKHAGTKTCAELISSLLIASNNGNVYNMTDSGTTTADFIEGAGIPIRAGDNVGVAKVGDNTYKFDLLSGFIDTSNFVTKSSTSGLIKNDGSIDTTEYAPASSVPAAQIQSDWSQSDNTKLDYIKNKPTLGTASAKNVPASGNASTSEVVMGNDTRLSDARNAADVYSWAKAENKPSYSKSEVGLGNVDNTSDTTKKTNFTGSIASGDTGFVTGGDAYTELNKKVDKVDGKGLSTNDYTTVEKTKLAGIAAGAEVNVQPDWDETDNTQDDYIKNKPEAYDAIWQNNSLLPNTDDVHPYLDRASSLPSGAIPYVKETIVGGSVVVNQLVQNGDFASNTVWNLPDAEGTFVIANGVLTYTVVTPSVGASIQGNLLGTIENHKYLVTCKIKANNTLPSSAIFVGSGGYSGTTFTITQLNTWVICIGIFSRGTGGNDAIRIYPRTANCNVGDTFDITDVQVIDLTQMFGTSIADTAYTKEQTTAGSGIAWLKSYGFFTKSYYPYNVGALQSVKTGSKKVVEKNLCDNSNIVVGGYYDGAGAWNVASSQATSGLIPVLPNTQYISSIFNKITKERLRSLVYTLWSSETVCQGQYTSETITTLADTKFIRIRNYDAQASYITSNNFLFQLEIGSQETSYEPYTSSTYPLDSDLELRGLYKLDANNNIVCDGDEYTPDGNVKRKYGIVDLGTLSWGYYTQGARLQATVPDRKYDQNRYKGLANWSYSFYDGHPSNMSDGNYTFSNSDTQIYVRDSTYGTDATSFKTAMSGVYLIYELATETTEEAASYQNPQIIHENGTEEFIDTRDYPLPVGHDTSYFTASDEKFFLPPVVDNNGRILYHDNDGFQFKKYTATDNNYTTAEKTKLAGISTGATKVESSTTNGNIKIDGTETQVYDDSELQDIVSTDETTVEGNPLNFSTLSAQHAKSTILSVEPIQDLHGYDKPWVGGAGKNLLPLTVNGIKSENTNNGTWNGNVFTHINGPTFTILTDSDNNVTGIKVTGTSTAVSLLKLSSVFTVSSEVKFNGLQSVGSYETFGMQILGSDGETSLQGMYNTIDYTQPSGTYSLRIRIANSYAIPTGGIEFKPMVRLSTVTDSTFQPYTNIASINGRTEIGILGCGKNLAYRTVKNGEITKPLGAGTYTVSVSSSITATASNTGLNLKLLLPDGTVSSNVGYIDLQEVTAGQWKSKSVNVTEGACIVFNGYGDNSNNLVNASVVKDNSMGTYEPYAKSNDLTISLGQTVYGGTLDVENGVLVVDDIYKIDLSNLNWSIESGSQTPFFTVSSAELPSLPNANKRSELICDRYETQTPSISDSNDGIIGFTTPGTYLRIRDIRYSDVNSFKASLTDCEICYPLAEPITIQLTPNEISLLEGVNNISTDGDKITLTYRDGSVATLGDLTSAVDSLDSKIDESKILTDTITGDKYILVVTNGVLDIQQISN